MYVEGDAPSASRSSALTIIGSQAGLVDELLMVIAGLTKERQQPLTTLIRRIIFPKSLFERKEVLHVDEPKLVRKHTQSVRRLATVREDCTVCLPSAKLEDCWRWGKSKRANEAETCCEQKIHDGIHQFLQNFEQIPAAPVSRSETHSPVQNTSSHGDRRFDMEVFRQEKTEHFCI